jgi:TPR repeat protein
MGRYSWGDRPEGDSGVDSEEILAESAYQQGADALRCGDRAGAALCWRKAADAGHPAAIRNLAGLYAGCGDIRSVRPWIEQAAEAGHPAAANVLATILAREGDKEMALRWLRRSAAAGDPDAASVLEAYGSESAELVRMGADKLVHDPG